MLAAINNPPSEFGDITRPAHKTSTRKRRLFIEREVETRCLTLSDDCLKNGNSAIDAREGPTKIGKFTQSVSLRPKWPDKARLTIGEKTDESFENSRSNEAPVLPGTNLNARLRSNNEDRGSEGINIRMLNASSRSEGGKGVGKHSVPEIAKADDISHEDARSPESKRNSFPSKTGLCHERHDMKGPENQLTYSKQLFTDVNASLLPCQNSIIATGSGDGRHNRIADASGFNGLKEHPETIVLRSALEANRGSDNLGCQKNTVRNQIHGHTVEQGIADVPRRTVSTNDLLKTLRKFNMTLKAVPPDSEIAKSLCKASRKCSAIYLDPASVKVRTAKLPQAINLKTKSQYVSTSRSTSSGTFSKWRLNASDKKHETKFKTARYGKIENKHTRRTANAAIRCAEHPLNENDHCAKDTGASAVPMIPLATAFDDLEYRDRATRETLEISCRGNSRPIMTASTDGSLEEGINLKTDPLLTSAALTAVDAGSSYESFLRLSTVIVKSKKDWDLQNENTTSLGVLGELGDVKDNCSKADDDLANVCREDADCNRTPASNVCATGHDSAKAEVCEEQTNNNNETICHLRTKKAEEWTSKEVLSWLSSTLRQYALSKSTSFSANVDTVRKGRHALATELFSHVSDADGLLNVTLDKLKQICSDDSLARYLFERVQLLSTGQRNCQPGDGFSDMHGVGQCAISAPISVNPNGIEQLQGSSNIDDLLTSDGMFPMEFSDVLDYQDVSYLDQLDNVPAPNTFRNHPPMPAVNRYRQSTTQSLHEEFNALAYMPSYRHDFTRFSSHYDSTNHVYNGSQRAASKAAACPQNMSMLGDDIGGVNGWTTPSLQGAQNHYYPSEASAHYSLSNADSAHGSLFAELISDTYSMTNAHSHSSRCPELLPISRQVSDNGTSSDVLAAGKRADIRSLASKILHEYAQENTDAYSYQQHKKCSPLRHDSNNSWTNKFDGMLSAQAGQSPLQCCEDKWDCSSTSSNATAVSAEAESKLLNMDDKSFQSVYDYPDKIKQNPHPNIHRTIYSPGKEQLKFELPELEHFPSESKASGTVLHSVQRGVTTIYPPFVTQMQRSLSTKECDDSSPIQDRAISNMFLCNSMESNGDVNSDLPSMEDRESIITHSASSESLRRTVSGQRHRSETTESYIESFDLKIRRTSGKSVTLWEFIRDTLLDPKYCPRLIKWEDRKAGVFRFVQSDVVAGMWGEKKNNPKMTYEKLSRAMRYYYNRGILERVDGRRLVYKFGRNAHGWQQSEFENPTPTRYLGDSKTATEEKPVDFPSTKCKARKKSCTISVAVCDDVLPAAKRHRPSSESPPMYVSVSADEPTPTEKPSLPNFYDYVTGENNLSNFEDGSISPVAEEKTGQNSDCSVPEMPPLEQPSCIVYVARHQVMEEKDTDQKDILLLENSKEQQSSWSQASQDILSSKLPSANVLLGKQYKIANAVI